MSGAAAAAFPNWVMLERFVFRRDDEASFPDASAAPIRASGTTSWGAPFTVAFRIAAPPRVSRLYAHLPGFPDPRKQVPVAILAAHRNLFLFRVGIVMISPRVRVQDMFIYDSASAGDPAAASSIKALPHCTEPDIDYFTRPDGSLRRSRPPASQENSKPRLLTIKSMGVLSRSEQEEFAVAELTLFKANRSEVYADIYLLRSSTSPADAGGGLIGGQWSSMRVPILVSDANPKDDFWQLCLWQTDTVIPFDNQLCWVDYYRGILLCDVFAEPAPTVSFLRFPLDAFPDTHNRGKASSWLYRAATAVGDDGHALKFVDVARNDDVGYGPLKPGAGFTVTCHTLGNAMVWSKDCTATSDELWNANPPDRLPREVLMFPQVDIDRSHVVHFLVSDYTYVMKKMWVVSIDMNTMTVESSYQYTNGLEDRGTEDADLTIQKSGCPLSFLPCEFSRFLQPFSRERKDMGSGSEAS